MEVFGRHKIRLFLASLAAFFVSLYFRTLFVKMQTVEFGEPLMSIKSSPREVEKALTSTMKTSKRDLNTATFVHRTSTLATKIVTARQCRNGRKKNLLFLKTHKTGSTSLQNIFIRYAWANDLLVGLPKTDNNFGYGERFSKKMMQPIRNDREVNMLMHHMVFDHQEVKSVLPADTTYVTVLRDPPTQFESSYKYFGNIARPFIRAKSSGGFKEFVNHPKKHFLGRKEGTFSWLAKNSMAHDLGFDFHNETDAYVHEILKTMDETFDLVMISEYLDISLLLFMDLMCWDMQDVVFLSVNARNSSTVEHLSKDVKTKLYGWNKLDTALYRHYNDTFWQRVEMYGRTRLSEDLKKFEALKKEVADYCVEHELVTNDKVKDPKFKMHNPPGLVINQYQLKEDAKNNETCCQLILPEIPWWRKMSKRQAPK